MTIRQPCGRAIRSSTTARAWAIFTGIYGNNPGGTLSLVRNEANGLLVPAGQTWPVPFSETSRLGLAAPCAPGVVNAACNPGAPTYPIAVRAARADSLSIFSPEIQISSARSYSVGLQRTITKNTALEVRYVGTRGINLWGTEAYNERNLLENGFIDEFKAAMRNLQANVAAGCGGAGQAACSFAYRGPGTGTTPLPIYLAYFVGSRDAGNPAAYSGANWTNTTFVGRLARLNPGPSQSAGDLDGDATRRANAVAAGLPANFFVLNPDVANVTTEVSHGSSTYDSLQVELRRRLSQGLQVNGSYAFGSESGSTYLGQHYGYALDPSEGVRHAFKVQWNYALPFGRGQRFGAAAPSLLDALIGGWSLNGVGRVQDRLIDFGSVRLVGMTPDDLQREYRVRLTDDPANPGRQLVTMLPDDIILNTRRAFNTSATAASGYSRQPWRAGSGRPLPGPRAERFLHHARRRGLRAPHAARAHALLHPRRSQRVEEAAIHGRTQPRLLPERAEPLRQRQLQPGRQPWRRSHDLPGDVGVHRSRQHLRPGGPAGRARVAIELVALPRQSGNNTERGRAGIASWPPPRRPPGSLRVRIRGENMITETSAPLRPTQLADIVSRLATRQDEWMPEVRLDPGKRWHHRLESNPAYRHLDPELASRAGDGVPRPWAFSRRVHCRNRKPGRTPA